MNITIVAGARPNFIKIAPIIHALIKCQKSNPYLKFRLVHTGQHYDKRMSGDFFDQLNIPTPDINLESGGGSQAEQTASIMIGFEKELITNKPDVVVVVGDVTSTLACTITAKKLGIDVAHVEAGIRSGDRSMPEEINRMVTDSISDFFFTTTENASANLIKLGHNPSNIHFVGNTMIDTLLFNMNRLKQPDIYEVNKLAQIPYLVLTLHRPANVDDPLNLAELLHQIEKHSGDLLLVFPVHPRTKLILEKIKILSPRILITEPLPYLEFNFLVKYSTGVITDSGGITEETTVMNIPCITLRDSTERPETVTLGTNEVIGFKPDALGNWLTKLKNGDWKQTKIPLLWDGKTSQRIVDILLSKY